MHGCIVCISGANGRNRHSRGSDMCIDMPAQNNSPGEGWTIGRTLRFGERCKKTEGDTAGARVKTGVFCYFYVSRTSPPPCTCNYCPLLPFRAHKRVYLRGYYKFSSDAKRVIYARKRVYLLVS